jgi:uncharacterized alkaline shock family protein YloU
MESRTKPSSARGTKAAKTLIQSRDLGRIQVSPRVVATIAAHAAADCYGIVGMAAQGLREGLAQRLHRESVHRGVDVELREDGVAISLYVIVEFGIRVTEVSQNLTNAVRYSIEQTLGLPVVEVNVNVQGVHVSGA